MGAPGVVLVRTSNKAQLQVDWDKLMSREPAALVFDPAKDVMYSTAFVFTRVSTYLFYLLQMFSMYMDKVVTIRKDTI